MVDDFNGFLCIFHREVVEHDTVRDVGSQCLADLVFVAGLDLDAEVFALLLAVVLSAGERSGDTA